MNGIDYDGRTAMVVGGASGMGLATARLVADLGADVVVLDIQDPLEGVGRFVHVDLRDPATIDDALDALGPGPIHALFSCSGVADGATGLPAVNFLGQRHLIESALSRELLPAGAAIAMIASIGGMGWEQRMSELGDLLDTPDFASGSAWFDAHPDHANYSFTKQAVIAYCGRRGPALVARGIRINCTAPGPVMTPLMASNEQWQGFEAGVRALTGVPGSTPEQQAWPLAFLASDAASYISGQCLVVDAGLVGGGMTGAIDGPLLDAVLPHRPARR